MNRPARNLLLRLSIAGAFLYPAIAGFLAPKVWLGWFPPAMHGVVPDMVLLGGWGVIEIVIALWILSGKRIFLPSLAATILLCLIVILNLSAMDVVFRDVALALVAAHLTFQARAMAVNT